MNDPISYIAFIIIVLSKIKAVCLSMVEKYQRLKTVEKPQKISKEPW